MFAALHEINGYFKSKKVDNHLCAWDKYTGQLKDLGHTNGTRSRQSGHIKKRTCPKANVNASQINQSNQMPKKKASHMEAANRFVAEITQKVAKIPDLTLC